MSNMLPLLSARINVLLRAGGRIFFSSFCNTSINNKWAILRVMYVTKANFEVLPFSIKASTDIQTSYDIGGTLVK